MKNVILGSVLAVAAVTSLSANAAAFTVCSGAALAADGVQVTRQRPTAVLLSGRPLRRNARPMFSWSGMTFRRPFTGWARHRARARPGSTVRPLAGRWRLYPQGIPSAPIPPTVRSRCGFGCSGSAEFLNPGTCRVKAGAPQAAPLFLTVHHARVCPFRTTFRFAGKKLPRGFLSWRADDRHRLSFGVLLPAAAADRRARCRLLGNPFFPRPAQPVLGSGTGCPRDRSPGDPLFAGLSGLARCLPGRALCGRPPPLAAGGNRSWTAAAARRVDGGGKLQPGVPLALGLPFWAAVAGLALDAAVVAAFALCIAALSTVSVLPLALGAAFAVAGKALGATIDYLARGADGDEELLASYSPVVDRIRWLLPDLSRLDWREWAMYQLAPGAEMVFWSVVMAIGYIVLLVVAASLLFSRREFS
jgi:hypothetical protein